jgi:hypothetical protein
VDIGTICDEEKRDPVFAAGLAAAEFDGKLLSLSILRKAQTSDDLKLALDASKWLLERKYWREWSKRSPDEVSPEQLAATFMHAGSLMVTRLPKEYHEVIEQIMREIISGLTQ